MARKDYILLLILMKKSTLNERSHRKELEERAEKLEGIVDERTKDLTLYAEKLAYSNRELEEFAFVASHDLQEPLRMVTNFTALLENQYGPQLDDTAREYIGFATNAASRMQALVNDLLEYSRIGKDAENNRNVDMNKTIVLIKTGKSFLFVNKHDLNSAYYTIAAY